LFEYWAGDDAISVGKHLTVIETLKNLTTQNVNVFLMHGNRDFLLGSGFANAASASILPDPSLITLYGKSVLLTHGDALCTDDIAYQQFRTEVRTEKWKAHFLGQPLDKRITIIEELRKKSEQDKSTKSMQIMDVNKTAVENLIADYRFPQILIHGHTHRPHKHIHTIQGHVCERWVLGDWYEQGSYLRLDKNGCHTQLLESFEKIQ